VDEDRRVPGLYIVRVQVADGEVVGGGVCVVEADSCDLGGAGRRLEDVALFEVLGVDEGGLGFVVEGVVERRCQVCCGGAGLRKRRLKIPSTWPWADEIVTVFRRLLTLPHHLTEANRLAEHREEADPQSPGRETRRRRRDSRCAALPGEACRMGQPRHHGHTLNLLLP
jgi:hypothetical protein